MRVRFLCIGAIAILLLSACGGSGGGGSSSSTGGGTPLSAKAYRAKLAKVKVEAAGAQAHVGEGLQAKTVPDLTKTVDRFAEETQRIGDEVAQLTPPANAQAANAQLAQGLHDISSATRTASAKIAKMATVKEAISYLEHSQIATQGSHEVDSALAKLTKLGYTTGS